MNASADSDLVALIRDDAAAHYAVHFADSHRNRFLPGGSCLYWAASAIIAAQRHGIRLVLQAGSAAFQRLPPHLDDGRPETLTHFAYEWTPPHKDPLRSRVFVRDGREEPTPAHFTTRPDRVTGQPALCLPEMHVWCGEPATQTLVDLSTFDLTRQCETVLGVPWLDEKPPPFLWCAPREIPTAWHYNPNRDATLLAALILADLGALP